MAWFMAGCTSAPHTPEPRIVTTEVKVPIATPCLKAADVPLRPDFPDKTIKAKTPIDEAVRLWIAGILARDAFIERQAGALAGCTE